jgi:hypothetical protein
MSDPASPVPGKTPRPTPADPIPMSLAEKLACEWEARHDVAARGRIADVAPVQNYLTHVRCEDNRHPHPGARARRSASEARRAGSVPPGLRGWLRWGEPGAEPPASGLPRGC